MGSPGRLDEAVDRVRLTPPDDRAGASGARAAIRKLPVVLTAAAVVVALVLTAIVFFRWSWAGSPEVAPTATPTVTPTRAPSTAEIYTAVAPSVVTVEAVHPGSNTVSSTGTGVIVNADATILTALHVVNDAGSIRVTFADGTTSTATITGADPTADVATLGPATLPSIIVPAVLGRSDRLAVGDTVIAIGNQLGLTSTTTAGVVSGLDRLAPGPFGANLSGLIQFDAAVNPGSSGGPLLNAKGETVGIVVALANPTAAGTFIGIGFAVPIATAVTAGGGGRVPQQ